MSEQLQPEQQGQSGTDYAALYKEQHKGAVEDVKKAEWMAHATDDAETRVIEAKNAALEAALESHIQEGGYSSGKPTEISAQRVEEKMNEAKAARSEADAKGNLVAETYDRLKRI